VENREKKIRRIQQRWQFTMTSEQKCDGNEQTQHTHTQKLRKDTRKASMGAIRGAQITGCNVYAFNRGRTDGKLSLRVMDSKKLREQLIFCC